MSTRRHSTPHETPNLPETLVPEQRRFEDSLRPGRLEEEAWVFYNVGRLSHNYTVQAGVFRRLLPEIELRTDERRVYDDWLGENAYTAVQAGLEHPPLQVHELAALRSATDPAVAIADALQQTYLDEYPGSEHDVRLHQKAEAGFNIVLASIHRPYPKYLQAVVEKYEVEPPTIDPAA